MASFSTISYGEFADVLEEYRKTKQARDDFEENLILRVAISKYRSGGVFNTRLN